MVIRYTPDLKLRPEGAVDTISVPWSAWYVFTRRQLLSAGAATSLFASSGLEAAPPAVAPGQVEDSRASLNGLWLFRLDPGARGESDGWAGSSVPAADWQEVPVPHTWQVEPAHTEYRGLAWYRRSFDVPPEWSSGAVRIEFESVFHTATVWVNGGEAGRHIGKGYTAFTLDITRFLHFGAANTLAVRVDNSFDDAMLPRGRSSDWAHDGGIYRPVRLLVTPKVFLERIAVDAEPDADGSTAAVGASAVIRNASGAPWTGAIGYHVTDRQTGNRVLSVANAAEVQLAPGETKTLSLRPTTVRAPRLWHFDHPNLYGFAAQIAGPPAASGHVLETTFGFRKIEIRGTAFYLNGERVRLMGVERMAGSNPEYGMAEPAEWIHRDHADMKELNCVYTRVHWPQDSAVLDWCDRHGMLIQTEVPAWGSGTFRGMTGEPSAEIMNNGLEQLREMIARDRNHPCIFSWGVCNEIGGQNPPAYAFAKRLYEEAKKLDPKRPVSYASNSLLKTPEKDVAGLMDYVMLNEYVESWQPGTVDDLARYLDQIHGAFPDKPLVISEYGYCACTPDRPEGDGKRISVLHGHDQVFRQRDYIAGLIFFCYNDYRTHVGDRGAGVMKQRVHGVVDVYGEKKPSHAQLRAESSPLERFDVGGKPGQLKVHLVSRNAVPAYSLRGYKLRAVVYGFGDIPVERLETPLPDLEPGSETSVVVEFAETRPVEVKLDVLRPTGFSAHTVFWRP